MAVDIVNASAFAQDPAFTTRYGLIAKVATGSVQTGIGTSPTALTGMSIDVDAPAGRRYIITGKVIARQRTALGLVTLEIRRGSTVLDTALMTLAIDSYGTLQLSIDDVPGAGVVTYTTRLSTSNNTVDTHADSDSLTTLRVEATGI
jgi:hypothetical protein